VTSLLLAQPLPGGAPAAGVGAQKVVAFVDREGGSFFQEWSGLFVAEEESGGRVCFFYPRLSPTTLTGAGASHGFQREEEVQVVKPIAAIALRAAFVALPHIDENNSQVVLCYRSYFPASVAAIY
jgi:hypothetical protein